MHWDENTPISVANLNNMEQRIAQAIANMENGKAIIAAAIQAMGQSASSSDTFAQMSTKIRDISKDANATAAQVLIDRTFYQGGVKRTGTMPNRTGHVTGQGVSRSGTTLRIRPQEGYYPGTSGNSVQWNDPAFVASNIAEDAEVFGLQGTAKRAIDFDARVSRLSALKISNSPIARGSRVMPNGELWEYFVNGSTVKRWRYNSNGSLLAEDTIYSGGSLPSSPTQSKVDVYEDCIVVYSSHTNASQILKLDHSGTLLQQYSPYYIPGIRSNAHDIAVNKSMTLLVSTQDYNPASYIRVYSIPSNTMIHQYSRSGYPYQCTMFLSDRTCMVSYGDQFTGNHSASVILLVNSAHTAVEDSATVPGWGGMFRLLRDYYMSGIRN